jgi:5-methylcytosine-specific restriction endonuclease McrA
MKKKKSKKGRYQKSKWISKERRLALYLRDSFTCQYCGTDLRGADPQTITLDHLKCRCYGGTHDSSNLVVACRSCNSSRGNKCFEQYATGGALKRIRKQRNLPMKKFRAMSRAILKGEARDPRLENRC